ncbi:MAG: MAPEG family protein [Deltaproteobacteria bacterium]|nr:MAPEG family protein [Deltaproteobacteria bacterium]
MMPTITALYAALNALIMVTLALLVVRHRGRAKAGIGDGGDPGLALAIRAHGNNTEYVPYALVLLLLVELGAWPAWLVHVLGIMLTVGRVAHGYGLSQSKGTSPGRAIGMLGTWLAILIAAGLCLWRAIVG